MCTSECSEWHGWVIAGVPPHVRDRLVKRGLNHRLIGLLGCTEAEASVKIRTILTSSEQEHLPAVLRAWQLGRHVLDDEKMRFAWGLPTVTQTCTSTQDPGLNVRERAGAAAKRQKRDGTTIPTVSNVAHALVSLQTQEQSEADALGEQLLVLADEIPHAGCWTRVAGRQKQRELLSRLFTPTKASTRLRYMGEISRYRQWAQRGQHDKWDWSADALANYIWDRQDEPCGATVPTSILVAIRVIGVYFS